VKSCVSEKNIAKIQLVYLKFYG